MTQFKKQSEQPLRPDHYRAAVRKWRRLCDTIEGNPDHATTARALRELWESAKHLWGRHEDTESR